MKPPRLPRYVQQFVDRHGKPRFYYRRAGYKRTALPGTPWSPDFMAAYQAAEENRPPVAAARVRPGSVSDLVARYYHTSDYRALSPTTQATYRGIIERFRLEHGDKRVAKLEREHVRRIIGAKSETPSAANNLLRMIRMLMKHALDMEMIRNDPTRGVRPMKTNSVGFVTWKEEHIEAFLARHPIGTRAHLALSLLLHTGQRRSDVVRMGRQHVREGVIRITQQKTGQPVAIPLHRDLVAALDATTKGQMTFMQTEQGKPFTPAGFTNWFRDRTREAGLPTGLSPHGLRKAICRRLAEAGCTPHTIMAITGHKTLKEVTRYTEAANRDRLAEQAIDALSGTGTGTQTVKPTRKV